MHPLKIRHHCIPWSRAPPTSLISHHRVPSYRPLIIVLPLPFTPYKRSTNTYESH
jgi:hypothetical protein